MNRAADTMAVLLIAIGVGGAETAPSAPVSAEASDGGSWDGGSRAFCGFYPVPAGYVCCNSHYMAFGREVVLGNGCAIDVSCETSASRATCTACHLISFAPQPETGIQPHYGGQQPDSACRGCHPRPWPQSLH